MTFLNTQPAVIGAPPVSAVWSQFAVSDPYRRRALLREACNGNAPVTIRTHTGHALSGSLWSMDDVNGTLHFKIESDVPEQAQLGQEPSDQTLWAVLYLKEVKVQFQLQDASLRRGPHGTSLRTDLPQTLYRLARRHSNRVKRAKGQVGHVSGTLPAVLGAGPFRWALFDVGMGGCGLWVPEQVPHLPAEMSLPGVSVELTGGPPFRTDMTLRHCEPRVAGRPERKAGCAWAPLLESAQQTLLRWQRGGQLQRDLVKITLTL